MRPLALVVGGDGRIARALIPALERSGYRVLATTRRRGQGGRRSRPMRSEAKPSEGRSPSASDQRAQSPGKGGQLDLDLDQVASSGSVQLPDCDVAFVCAAMSGYAECRCDETRAHAVNAEAPAAIARALVGRGAQLVLLSTNGVFDGAKPFCSAADPPDGATAYGRSKALAEASVRAIDASAAILRLTRVFVPGEPLLAGWAEKLRGKKPVEAFANMVAAPVHVDHVVAALLAIARARSPGILQLSARREVAYVEIARHIAARVGASPDLVAPVAAEARGIGPGEAPRHASLACDDFGLAPIEPFEVVDAVLGL